MIDRTHLEQQLAALERQKLMADTAAREAHDQAQQVEGAMMLCRSLLAKMERDEVKAGAPANGEAGEGA